jgi:hypothetical protein
LSEKREYLWAVFDGLHVHPKLGEAALIFYHAEVPVAQARAYLKVLAPKINKEKQ